MVIVEPTAAIPEEKFKRGTPVVEESMQNGERARQDEDADKRRAAEKEAAEAQRRRAIEEEEVRRKTQAEEEAAREAAAKEAAAKEAAAQQNPEAGGPRTAGSGEPAAPMAPEAVDIGLPLTFRDASGAKTYTVKFTTKPLCMDFDNNTKPVRVTKSFGVAKRLGVLEGSDLIKVADTDVEQLAFMDILEKLSMKIEPLTPDGLVISFRDRAGTRRPIVFPTKPLGMDFQQDLRPVKIDSVAGIAESLGVQAGWELATIAGNDVEQMEFDKMLELLREQVAALPAMD